MVKFKINTPDPKDHDPDKKESIFVLTISPNKRPLDVKDAHRRAAFLAETIMDVLMEDNLKHYLTVKYGDYMDAIDDVDILVSPEMGHKQGGFIHAHVVLTIKHHDKVRLDLEWIKDKLKEELVGVQDIRNVYVKLEVMRGGPQAILNYVMKQYSGFK